MRPEQATPIGKNTRSIGEMVDRIDAENRIEGLPTWPRSLPWRAPRFVNVHQPSPGSCLLLM
jgi:hypothetical protein